MNNQITDSYHAVGKAHTRKTLTATAHQFTISAARGSSIDAQRTRFPGPRVNAGPLDSSHLWVINFKITYPQFFDRRKTD